MKKPFADLLRRPSHGIDRVDTSAGLGLSTSQVEAASDAESLAGRSDEHVTASGAGALGTFWVQRFSSHIFSPMSPSQSLPETRVTLHR